MSTSQNNINFTMSSFLESPSNLLDAITAYTDKRKKPKRNRSAFILFSIEIRKKLDTEGLDELNPNDKFVRIAEMWKNLDEKQKKVYEDKAKEEKEKYASDLSDFCKAYPSAPIQRPRNHIKKPCNAYGYFLKQVKEDIREKDPNLRMCEVLRIVGERWKNITPQEKQKYELLAENSRRLFKEEVNKQTELSKRLKFSESTSPSIKDKARSPESYHSDMEDLVCKDISVKSYDSHDHKENIMNLPNLTKKRSTTSTEKRIMMPIVSPPSTYSQDSYTYDKHPSFGMKMGGSVSAPIAMPTVNNLQFGFNEPNNVYSAYALQGLYWKVEQLRQHIWMQMQRPTPAHDNYDQSVLQLLSQLNQENLYKNKLNEFKGNSIGSSLYRETCKREDC